MILMLGLISTATAGFGGAGVNVVGEFDVEGPELLVDLTVDPYVTDKGDSRITWAPLWVSWGILPTSERIDHLEASLLLGERRVGSGDASAWTRLGTLRYDQEDQLADVEPGAVGVGIDLLDDRLQIDLGADLRLRFVETTLGDLFDSNAEKEVALLLGIPLGASWEQEISGPIYAEGKLRLRPGLGLLGTEPFAFDSNLGLLIGVHAIDEADARLDVGLGYNLRIDTFTALNPTVEHRIGIGARMAF
jgi:hypothetical protein